MWSTDRRLLLLAGIFALVAVGGVVHYRTAPPLEFGWFAYTPLPDEVDIPDPPSVSSRQLLGLTLTALGLAGAAATLGYHRGRRSIDRHEAQS